MIKIMIVEDDPMVAAINRGYAEKIPGYQVVCQVANIQDARKQLEQNEIDLILLDVYMPNGSGLDLFKEVRQQDIDVDIIFITAASETETISYTLRHGIVDFLIKPFTFERFRQALESYQQQRGLLTNAKLLNQGQIDQRFFAKEKESVQYQLPKGLAEHTLLLIMKEIRLWAGKDFTTEELTQCTGITRVSIRKYLKFLIEVNLIEEHLVYGGIGRPISHYQYRPQGEVWLEKYLDSHKG